MTMSTQPQVPALRPASVASRPIRLKSHMAVMSLRQVRFAVWMPDEPVEGDITLVNVSGVLSYDLFRKDPHSVDEAAEIFVRNREVILAGFLRAFRRAQAEPGADGLVISLVPADLPDGSLA
jgi:hypothetical protein